MTGVTLKPTLPMMLCMGVLVWLSSFVMEIPPIVPDGGLVVVGSNLVPWGVVSGLFGFSGVEIPFGVFWPSVPNLDALQTHQNRCKASGNECRQFKGKCRAGSAS